MDAKPRVTRQKPNNLAPTQTYARALRRAKTGSGATAYETSTDPRRAEELEQLIGKAHEGEIESTYVDETGFSLAPPMRSAWTLRGKTHKAQPQKAGRLNVMGAMFSSGGLYFSGTWGTTTSLAFAGFLSQLLKRTAKPLVVTPPFMRRKRYRHCSSFRTSKGWPCTSCHRIPRS